MNWPKLLSTAQACDFSGLSLVELNELADAGLIKFIIPCKEKENLLGVRLRLILKRRV